MEFLNHPENSLISQNRINSYIVILHYFVQYVTQIHVMTASCTEFDAISDEKTLIKLNSLCSLQTTKHTEKEKNYNQNLLSIIYQT